MAAPNMKLIRYSVNNEYQEVYSNRTGIDKWSDINYRKITFLEPPTGALLTWLQANGVKQDLTIAAQDTKSVTITKNGTTTITPDAPYDAIKKVNVTTNVGGSSSSDEIGKLTINVIQQPTTDEWDLCVCGKTLDDNEIVLNNNNLSAEINIAKNKLFVLYTTLCIDYVETSDWGLFDFVGMSTDYVQNNEYIPTKTYVCYAGNTNTATWNIAFR